MPIGTGSILTRLNNFFRGSAIGLGIIAAALFVFVVACGGEETDAPPSPSITQPSPAIVVSATLPPESFITPVPVASTITVKVAEHADLGTILVDGNGRTLYLRTGDERNKSNCAGGCASAWPPLLTAADALAGEGVTAQVLKNIIRDDGSNQVAYNGWPLYYFAGDEAPGDAKGQNAGDVWFVVSIYGGPKQNNAIVRVSEHPELGAVLADASDRTLYLFTVDERDRPNCLHGCAMAWPPLLTIGESVAMEGIAEDHQSSVTRDNGSEQVTYNGWPLYYYALDPKPGDAKGQNSGLIWYVVSTYGGPIQTNAVVMTSVYPGLGTILTEAGGRTVYVFTEDEPDKSLCSGGCALARPSLLTVGSPTAQEGVASERLDSIRREDGYLQVTYNGRPLYYFAPDETPGDVMGQAAGDVWFVVSLGGEAVKIELPTPVEMDHALESTTPVVLETEPTSTPETTSIETPAPVLVPTPTSPSAISLPPAVQVLATIETYAASQFFPSTFIVIKDVPVTLLMTRLHKEHVNKFTIEPFVSSRPFALPGEVANVEFTPDQSGAFEMRNIGHFFEAEFIVADSVAAAKTLILHHPGARRCKVFFYVVGVPESHIPDLRPFHCDEPEGLAFFHIKSPSTERRHVEFFDKLILSFGSP